MPFSKPAFLITIDTEGDNLWSRPSEIKTENARFLPRFQELCERFQLKPTYLTNWEMAACPVFQEFGQDVLQRGTAEIGMHLHAWNSPPIVPLTDDDYRHQPYLIEYPIQAMRDKIHALTDRLEDTFGCGIVSHRAGRWAFDESYARLLIERGYRVDCSVTPGVNWQSMQGSPTGTGGSDYTDFPDEPYFVGEKVTGTFCAKHSESRVGKRCLSPFHEQQLLEVPMTVVPARPGILGRVIRRCAMGNDRSPVRRAVNALLPDLCWLRPNGRNLSSMLQIIEQGCRKGDRHLLCEAPEAGKRDGANLPGRPRPTEAVGARCCAQIGPVPFSSPVPFSIPHLEFMLHSSEFMPGGSLRFPTPRSIERLYDHLEQLFQRASTLCQPATLSEFERRFRLNASGMQSRSQEVAVE